MGERIEIVARMHVRYSLPFIRIVHTPLNNTWKNPAMLQTLMNLNESIKENYIEGKPLLFADAKKSIFKLLTESEYAAHSTEEIQETLRTQHIIVKDRKVHNYDFDEKGLRTLRPLNEPVGIVGESHLHTVLGPQHIHAVS
jgi:hypothetical protein